MEKEQFPEGEKLLYLRWVSSQCVVLFTFTNKLHGAIHFRCGLPGAFATVKGFNFDDPLTGGPMIVL